MKLQMIYTVLENRDIQKIINKRLGGKAKIYHAPYGGFHNDSIWWTILLTNKKKIPGIQKSLQDLGNTIGYQPHIHVDGRDPLPDIEHGVQLVKLIKSHYDIDEILDQNPQLAAIIVFFVPQEEEVKSPHTLFHVTYNADVLRDGLIPQGNLKYQNRIYLWDDYQQAISFAYNSYHANKSVAYIFEVKPVGKVYKDQEEPDAYYTKSSIPPQNLKMIETIDIN